jgi:ribosomal subunit interface protein
MRISFHKQGIELDDAQRDHIELRLQFALGRFAPRVTHVAVHVADTNGRRGGVDKRCRLVTRVTGLDELVVEDHDQSFYVLIDRVTERLGHTVGRRLERERFGNERVAFDGQSPRTQDKTDA